MDAAKKRVKDVFWFAFVMTYNITFMYVFHVRRFPAATYSFVTDFDIPYCNLYRLK